MAFAQVVLAIVFHASDEACVNISRGQIRARSEPTHLEVDCTRARQRHAESPRTRPRSRTRRRQSPAAKKNVLVSRTNKQWSFTSHEASTGSTILSELMPSGVVKSSLQARVRVVKRQATDLSSRQRCCRSVSYKYVRFRSDTKRKHTWEDLKRSTRASAHGITRLHCCTVNLCHSQQAKPTRAARSSWPLR